MGDCVITKVICVKVLLVLTTVASVAQSTSRTEALLSQLDTITDRGEIRFELLRQIAQNHTNFREAVEFSHEAYTLSLEIGRRDLQAKALEQIGLNERLLGNNIEATDAALSALKIYEELDNRSAQAAIFVQLGSNAVVDENYEEAVRYFLRSLSIYKLLTGSVSKSNHALTRINLGEAYRLSSNFDSAIYWFQSGLDLRNSIEEQYRVDIVTAYATGNLGMTYNSLDELGKARDHLTRAIEMTEQLGDPYTTSVYLADLGLVEEKEGNAQIAEQYLVSAYDMALTEGLKEQIRDISEMLVNHFTAQRSFEKAWTYQRIYQQYQDSLVNRDNIRKVEQLKANYEIDKRESEIGFLTQITNQQRVLNIGLGGGITLLLVFAFIIYRTNRRLKSTNQQLTYQKEQVTQRESEKALLLSELNHRVKNNLQMITSLLALQESQLKGHPAEAAISAGKYRVKALSLIHRKLYQEDHHTDIALDDYLQELTLNLCHGFGVSWSPTLQLQSVKVHIDTAVPLALIINELVTNALKYAFHGIESPALNLTMESSKGKILIVVRDNGVGMKNTTAGTESFGTRLVQSLVQQIDGTLELLEEVGTAWRLELPLDQN